MSKATDISKINEHSPYLDHCKGCGICERVCSFGAITMKEGI